MESPQIRPGLVEPRGSMPRVIAFFRNGAEGNLAIQLLVAIGGGWWDAGIAVAQNGRSVDPEPYE